MRTATKKFHTFHWCEKCYISTHVEDHTPCCVKPDYDYVRYKQSNGVYTLRKQCNYCLSLMPNSFKKTSVDNFEALPESTPQMTHTERWQEYNKFRQYIRQRNEEIFEENKEQWNSNYALYLSSEEWRKKREMILKRDNYICQGCLTENATEVHHRTYLNVGNEFCFELISLCETCHERVHDK